MKHVDGASPPSRSRRILASLATTPLGRFVSRNVSWKLDPFLLRVSGGRMATTMMVRSAVLETTGAKTGKRRTNALIYFHDGEELIIVASNAGASQHPGWFHNIIAQPSVRLGGEPMVASIVDDEDRLRLWPLADAVFPAFEQYRRDAAAHGRSIPMLRLSKQAR